jgi:hypothetical protein
MGTQDGFNDASTAITWRGTLRQKSRIDGNVWRILLRFRRRRLPLRGPVLTASSRSVIGNGVLIR